MKGLLLLVCCILLSWQAKSQHYILFFNGKAGTTHSLSQPQAFLSGKALAKRQQYGIPLDSTDLPVPARHMEQLSAITGVSVLQTSKWLNAAAVKVTTAAALDLVQQLPFVGGTRFVRSMATASGRENKPMLGYTAPQEPEGQTGMQEDVYQYGSAQNQVLLHKGNFLHNIGLRGDSMVIGILDAGFFRYNQLPAFDSVRSAGRVLGTFDFVAGDSMVAEDNAHGMQCFSIIAANMPGNFVGTAPKASFYLFRSEDAASETQLEELYWVAAAEKLDSAGAHIISSSLGYNQFDRGIGNYSYADMNGDRTLSARGADLAARKGMLVVNSAGNSGNSTWKYITTPADGDSVLAVGAVDANGNPAAFSSYGPTSDGRIKPDVAAVGVNTVLQATNSAIGTGNGTSFSCPIITGLAACLWQGFPERSNMELIGALRQSGSNSAQPNDRTGYGIPDMRQATGLLLKAFAITNLVVQNCQATLSWRSKDAGKMRYVVERLAEGSTIWEPIASLNSTGESWAERSYSITDRPATSTAPVTYRVQQVLDTSATNFYAIYLDTVQSSLSSNCPAVQRFGILSDGASGPTVLFQFPEPIPNLKLVWYNSAGQQHGSFTGAKPAGSFRQRIPVGTIPAGVYYLRVFSGNSQLATLEFLKL